MTKSNGENNEIIFFGEKKHRKDFLAQLFVINNSLQRSKYKICLECLNICGINYEQHKSHNGWNEWEKSKDKKLKHWLNIKPCIKIVYSRKPIFEVIPLFNLIWHA